MRMRRDLRSCSRISWECTLIFTHLGNVCGRTWATVTVAALVLVVILFDIGCQSTRRDGDESSPTDVGAGAAVVPAWPSDNGPWHINEALRLWETGQKDEALVLLRNMYRAQVAPTFFRLYAMSEADFVTLPSPQRDRLREQMKRSLKVLRHVARAMIARGEEAARAGNMEEAEEWREALRTIGRANRAPAVPLLVDLVGRAIQEKADELLFDAEARERRP